MLLIVSLLYLKTGISCNYSRSISSFFTFSNALRTITSSPSNICEYRLKIVACVVTADRLDHSDWNTVTNQIADISVPEIMATVVFKSRQNDQTGPFISRHSRSMNVGRQMSAVVSLAATSRPYRSNENSPKVFASSGLPSCIIFLFFGAVSCLTFAPDILLKIVRTVSKFLFALLKDFAPNILMWRKGI